MATQYLTDDDLDRIITFDKKAVFDDSYENGFYILRMHSDEFHGITSDGQFAFYIIIGDDLEPAYVIKKYDRPASKYLPEMTLRDFLVRAIDGFSRSQNIFGLLPFERIEFHTPESLKKRIPEAIREIMREYEDRWKKRCAEQKASKKGPGE